jgi:hypothetical protein
MLSMKAFPDPAGEIRGKSSALLADHPSGS